MSDTIHVSVVKYGQKYLRLQYRDPVTGRKRVRSAGTTSRREAERKAAIWESELENGTYRAKSRITWENFRDAYEQHVSDNLSDSTLNRVWGTFNQLERVIAPDRLASIGKEQLQQFADAMKSAGRSIETIRSHSRHLAVAFNWAVKNRMLPVAPEPAEITYKVNGKRIKREKSGGRPLAGEEFERMILAVSGTLYRTPDREPDPEVVASWQRLLRGLWWSGLRISEAHYLTWDDDRKPCVNFSGKRPMLWIPAEYSKSGEDAECPMAPEFAEMLCDGAKEQRTGFIFNPVQLRPLGKRASLDTVKRKISDFGTRANIKVKDLDNGKLKFASSHDLRRSFGFRWSQRVMPAVLKELMRHKSIGTTMEYYATQRRKKRPMPSGERLPILCQHWPKIGKWPMTANRRKSFGIKMVDAGLEPTAKTTGKTGGSESGDVKSDVTDAELRRIAAELRCRLTADECRRLAAILGECTLGSDFSH